MARFFVKPSKHDSDLDNMIKMLIDSLGAGGLFKPSRGGGKRTSWNTDDHWVHVLEAVKSLDADKPRIEVSISITDQT